MFAARYIISILFYTSYGGAFIVRAPTVVRLASSKSSTIPISPEAQELESILLDKQKNNSNHHKILIAQIAPSVRISFPELYGDEPGSYQSGVLVSALKELGFDYVLDTNTAADLTICEEGVELLHRILAREKMKQVGHTNDDIPEPPPLPLFTSCCPGWLIFLAKSSPELVPYISSCKSPHMMYGAVVKRNSKALFGEEKPENIYFCSVMPCIKKRKESDHVIFSFKSEAEDGSTIDVRDIDNVITTKDLGDLLNMHSIDSTKLEPLPFDSPFQNEKDEDTPSGLGTGAGQLFGVTGGVMEAATRSVYEIVTGVKLSRLEFNTVHEGLKEATLSLYNEDTKKGLDIELKLAVVNGLGEAKKLIKDMKDGNIKYDFVEVMACPGGCIGGGGQPKSDKEMIEKRREAVYKLDKEILPLHRSHENPTVKKLYADHLGGEYGSDEAEEILHVKPVYGGQGGESEDT